MDGKEKHGAGGEGIVMFGLGQLGKKERLTDKKSP